MALQTIQLPLTGDFVRGDTFPAFSLTIDRTGISRIRCQIRASTMETVVMQWDSEDETLTYAVNEEGKTQAVFSAVAPALTAVIRPGFYRGGVKIYFENGPEMTYAEVQIQVLDNYTR